MAWEAPDGAIVSLILDGRQNSQQVMLTLHYRINTNFGAPWDVSATFTAWSGVNDGFGGLYSVYADCLSTDMVAIRALYQVIHPTRYIYQVYPPAANAGTVAGGAEPPNVAHVVTMQATSTGRHSRGNKHIGGVPKTFTSGGMVTVAGLAAYNGLRDNMQLPIDINGDGTVIATPIIFRRELPDLSQDIFTGTVQQTTRVERRRTVGLGT